MPDFFLDEFLEIEQKNLGKRNNCTVTFCLVDVYFYNLFFIILIFL